jgi:hypothetical protein
MRISAEGNVGIGTTAGGSSSKLTVADSNTSVGLEVIPDAANNRMTLLSYDRGASAYKTFNIHADDFTFKNDGVTESFRIDASGNLLVGKTSSESNVAGFAVRGEAGNLGLVQQTKPGATGSFTNFYSSTALAGSITLTSATTVNYGSVSDVRMKENVVDAPAGNIDSIKVRSFDWKADGSHQEYGFIAQELETVAPYAVAKGETDEDMWAVDYSKLVPMLVKEIQDLKAEVAALKGA